MVDWQRFIPHDFEYDFEKDKLGVHGVNLNEAIQCFSANFQVRRNKSYSDHSSTGIVNLTFVVAFFSLCQGESMSVSYKYHRFPIEIIRHCVWLYYTFPLSYRDIEKMMLYRGIEVTYEAICKWCKKFAQAYANQIRKRRPKPADKWHLDEVVITIKGQPYHLWRAVDAQGQVLDILMQSHRDKRAAKKFFRKLLKSTGFAPRVIVTDKLRSYGAAQKELIPGVEHKTAQGFEQSSGEFAQADPSEGEAHGSLQIAWRSTTVPCCL